MTVTLRIRLSILSLLLFTACVANAQTPPGLPADFDVYVARTLKEFDVPGAAVAVVKDGRIVLAKGYGVRKIGDPTPVDERTLFGIASNSKAFDARGVGRQVKLKQ